MSMSVSVSVTVTVTVTVSRVVDDVYDNMMVMMMGGKLLKTLSHCNQPFIE